ncbi:hypothetical protein KA005_43055, partial [bacterium]|nr:hypothetical protein [bacterium]
MMKRTLKSLMLAMLAAAVLLAYPTYSMSQVWTNLGLYGGQIHSIAIDPSNPDKVFAGSYMGDGLFVTTDGGSSWQAVEATNDPPGEGTFKNHKIFDIGFAPSDPQTIWVAHNYWVEKSTDGGLTWTHIWNADMQKDCSGCTENEDFRFCQAIAIHPTNPNIVYVGAGGP